MGERFVKALHGWKASPFLGQVAAGTHTCLIIQVLQDGCVPAFHHSQPPCCHTYPFKSVGLAFAPVPFGCPGPTRMKEAPRVLQWGPKVVSVAVPSSHCPSALLATVWLLLIMEGAQETLHIMAPGASW